MMPKACKITQRLRAAGMYSSSNNDFVRGTVTDFYEMFRQVSESDGTDLSAFAFNQSAINGLVSDDVRVCPLDDMEAALKIRNEAMKQRCSAVHIDHLKTVLMAVRMIADAIVFTVYIIMEIVLGLMRLVVPGIDTQARAFEEQTLQLVC